MTNSDKRIEEISIEDLEKKIQVLTKQFQNEVRRILQRIEQRKVVDLKKKLGI